MVISASLLNQNGILIKPREYGKSVMNSDNAILKCRLFITVNVTHSKQFCNVLVL